jgi:hypothetical protein
VDPFFWTLAPQSGLADPGFDLDCFLYFSRIINVLRIRGKLYQAAIRKESFDDREYSWEVI